MSATTSFKRPLVARGPRLAAGAYTFDRGTRCHEGAFEDYYDHLTELGMLTITRWSFDGLASSRWRRLRVKPADAPPPIRCHRAAGPGATFLSETPFTREDVARLRSISEELGSPSCMRPGRPTRATIYAKLVLAPDRQAFTTAPPRRGPTTDTRPSSSYDED